MWMSAGGVIGGIFAGLIAPNIFSCGGRVSGAGRARDPVPARPRNADRHAHAPALARRRRGRRRGGVSRPGRALRDRREGLQLDHRRDAGGRRPRVARAVAVRRRDRGRVHHRDRPIGPTATCARRCAASSACTRSPRLPTAGSACSCTAPRSTAPSGCATTRASRSPASRRMITYYHANSPMGVTVKAVRQRVGGPIRVAVVGLGTGTFACFAEPGDSFKFYEIDASVEKLARDPCRFSYIARCAPDVPVGARRRAADARRDVGPVRPDRPRRVLLRRDPDPPDDARGDGDLCVASSRRTASC